MIFACLYLYAAPIFFILFTPLLTKHVLVVVLPTHYFLYVMISILFPLSLLCYVVPSAGDFKQVRAIRIVVVIGYRQVNQVKILSRTNFNSDILFASAASFFRIFSFLFLFLIIYATLTFFNMWQQQQHLWTVLHVQFMCLASCLLQKSNICYA